MSRRPDVVEQGHLRGLELAARLSGELRTARLDRGLSQASVATAVGVDRTWISRLERGDAGDVGIVLASEVAAAVGLDLAVRTFPSAGPLRAAGHGRLLDRLRHRLHPSLGWATEVPLPHGGDLHAWDALIRGPGWLGGVEAETHPNDLQALERRLALKLRDGGVDFLILLLLDSRHNRALVASHADALQVRFPVGARQALGMLATGRSPGGNALILL